MEDSYKSRIELCKHHIDYLSNLPESGMGYQIVRLVMKDGTILKNRIIFNSQYLQISKDEYIDVNLIDKIEIDENNTR